jgi:hypothetical protein
VLVDTVVVVGAGQQRRIVAVAAARVTSDAVDDGQAVF